MFFSSIHIGHLPVTGSFAHGYMPLRKLTKTSAAKRPLQTILLSTPEQQYERFSYLVDRATVLRALGHQAEANELEAMAEKLMETPILAN